MTREQAKQLLPIIQAFSEGKTIECYSTISKKWYPVEGINRDILFNGPVE